MKDVVNEQPVNLKPDDVKKALVVAKEGVDNVIIALTVADFRQIKVHIFASSSFSHFANLATSDSAVDPPLRMRYRR
jgi:hypothetical protein